MNYDVYVDNIKVGNYDNYYDVALSKAFWKSLFETESGSLHTRNVA